MILLVGCSETNIQQPNIPQSQPLVGGGCMVQGVKSSQEANQISIGDEL